MKTVQTSAKLQWVKKRDGRIVPFQKEKIAAAIDKALKSTDQDDQLLAQEMAEAVTLFLDKSEGSEIPDIETIQDAVERVLIEMKLFATAKAYILYRDKRARLREAMQQPAKLPKSQAQRWDREKIIRALREELQIPRMLAERITDIVEANTIGSSGALLPPEQMDLSIN